MRRDIEPLFCRFNPLAFEIFKHLRFLKPEGTTDLIEWKDPALDHSVNGRFRNAEDFCNLVDGEEFRGHTLSDELLNFRRIGHEPLIDSEKVCLKLIIVRILPLNPLWSLLGIRGLFQFGTVPASELGLPFR